MTLKWHLRLWKYFLGPVPMAFLCGTAMNHFVDNLGVSLVVATVVAVVVYINFLKLMKAYTSDIVLKLSGSTDPVIQVFRVGGPLPEGLRKQIEKAMEEVCEDPNCPVHGTEAARRHNLEKDRIPPKSDLN